MLWSMQRTSWLYREDKIIAKILFKKKPPNLVKTREEKSNILLIKKLPISEGN